MNKKNIGKDNTYSSKKVHQEDILILKTVPQTQGHPTLKKKQYDSFIHILILKRWQWETSLPHY